MVVVVLSALVLGLLVPATGVAADVARTARTAAIVLLFFLYGGRMATKEVWDGLRNVRLQGRMLAATYVVFPLLGLLVQLVPGLEPEAKHGLLFLCLLPSTVQASVVFTSVARGNVAGALTGATISNLVGIVLTPLLVGLLLVHTGGTADATDIVVQLLLPFAVGQLVQPWIGPWLRGHPRVTRTTDRSAIALVAYVSVSEATSSGAWDHVTVGARVQRPRTQASGKFRRQHSDGVAVEDIPDPVDVGLAGHGARSERRTSRRVRT